MRERRSHAATLALILVLPHLASAQEVISVADFEGHGVVIESAFHGGWIHDVAGVGDIDADGLDDLLVLHLDPVTGFNLATLIYGGSVVRGTHTLENLPRSAVIQLPAGIPGSTQESAAPAGDVNGDGHADFFFGQPYRSFDAASNGTGLLVYGSKSLEGDIALEDLGAGVPATTFWCSDTNSRGVGRATATIGDFDGDGRADVAVGAPSYPKVGFELPEGIVPGGRVYVVFGASDLSPVIDLAQAGREIPGMFIQGPSRSRPNGPHDQWGYFGIEITPVGDFDGDGFDDFLVSQTNFIPRTYFLIHGREDPPAMLDLNQLEEGVPLPGVTSFAGPETASGDNRELGGAGGGADFNGDGLPDIVVGVPRRPGNPFASGWSTACIVYGRNDVPARIDLGALPPADADVVFRAGSSDAFGTSIAPAGDFNSDGIPDLLIGADRVTVRGRERAGAAFVIYGKRDLASQVSVAAGFDGIRLEGVEPDAYLGDEVASAGDFNGDGTSDVVVLASSWSNLGTSRIYVLYGRPADPAPLELSTIEPDFGPVRGGTEVLLTGSGFVDPVDVRFGDAAALRVEVLSTTRIRAVAPRATEPARVAVTVTVRGESVLLERAYEYTPDFPEIRVDALGTSGLVVAARAGGTAGRSLSIGDVTGDGTGELIVGSTLNEPDRWLAAIVAGGPDLPASLSGFEPGGRVTLVTAITSRGETTASVIGDVNGDGIADLGLAVRSGHGFVLFGREAFPEREILIEDEVFDGTAVRLEHAAAARFHSIVGAGDPTGDGLDDFAVALEETSGRSEIAIFSGRELWPEIFDVDARALSVSRIFGPIELELGRELRAVGDVNGDGLVDLLAGTSILARAYLILGAEPLGAIGIDALVESGGAVSIELPPGLSVSRARVAAGGDVNGDGLDDLLLGVEGVAQGSQGTTYLIYGRRELPAEIVVTEDGPPTGVSRFVGKDSLRLSGRIGPAGDFNDDGYADFLIATQLDPLDAVPTHVSLVFGGDSLPGVVDLGRLGALGFKIEIPETAVISIPTSEVGDLNADGVTDFAFTQSANFEGTDPGKVYVIYGQPGERKFVRGDANSDAAVNIADALSILAYLFSAGEAPRCEDAADTDDSGSVAITDAVNLLQHLFQGGASPPPPYPDTGPDPTADGLRCRGA